MNCFLKEVYWFLVIIAAPIVYSIWVFPFLSNDKIFCGQALSKHLSCTGSVLKVRHSLWCGFLQALGGLSCKLLV